jgi:hypothetical protein
VINGELRSPFSKNTNLINHVPTIAKQNFLDAKSDKAEKWTAER